MVINNDMMIFKRNEVVTEKEFLSEVGIIKIETNEDGEIKYITNNSIFPVLYNSMIDIDQTLKNMNVIKLVRNKTNKIIQKVKKEYKNRYTFFDKTTSNMKFFDVIYDLCNKVEEKINNIKTEEDEGMKEEKEVRKVKVLDDGKLYSSYSEAAKKLSLHKFCHGLGLPPNYKNIIFDYKGEIKHSGEKAISVVGISYGEMEFVIDKEGIEFADDKYFWEYPYAEGMEIACELHMEHIKKLNDNIENLQLALKCKDDRWNRNQELGEELEKLKGAYEDTLTEHQFNEIEKDKENEVLKKENEHLYELINILRLKEIR